MEQISDGTQNTVTADDNILMTGAVLGGGLGWRNVHFMFEVNALYYAYDANILDTKVSLSGIDFYPALGIRVQFH